MTAGEAPRSDLESIHRALVAAKTLMQDSGHWVNAAGHQTDAALWIERAMNIALSGTVPRVSAPTDDDPTAESRDK